MIHVSAASEPVLTSDTLANRKETHRWQHLLAFTLADDHRHHPRGHETERYKEERTHNSILLTLLRLTHTQRYTLRQCVYPEF